VFSRGFEHLKNQEAKAACMLPNQARYHLRYIPIVLWGSSIVPQANLAYAVKLK